MRFPYVYIFHFHLKTVFLSTLIKYSILDSVLIPFSFFLFSFPSPPPSRPSPPVIILQTRSPFLPSSSPSLASRPSPRPSLDARETSCFITAVVRFTGGHAEIPTLTTRRGKGQDRASSPPGYIGRKS